MLKALYRHLKRFRILVFFPRILFATSYFNAKYIAILKWGFSSREDTNFTYNLTQGNLFYLAHTLAVVSKRTVAEMMGYMQEALEDTLLTQTVLEATRRSSFRSVADPKCCFGRRLGWYALARTLKPHVIVETGVDKGLGAVLLCAALLKNKSEGHEGRYFGTDINPQAGYLLSGPYRTVGQILYGDSLLSLQKLTVPIDLFINDSDHSADYEYREYQAIKQKLSPQAFILGDNAHVTDQLARFSLENGRRFLFFKEVPQDHWYPGAGIGISFV